MPVLVCPENLVEPVGLHCKPPGITMGKILVINPELATQMCAYVVCDLCGLETGWI